MLNPRTKGHQYERKIANEFSELVGYKIFTNRLVNKQADWNKVDITIPEFNIQCKNTAKNINYSSILKDMEEANDDKNTNIIFSKVTHKGEFVILRKKDFIKLWQNQK